jgi:hypothetical protein
VKPADISGITRWIYLKDKIMSLQRTVRIRTSDLYRGINQFKSSRSTFIKDENGDLLARTASSRR